jgi:hypothetical protein
MSLIREEDEPSTLVTVLLGILAAILIIIGNTCGQ